MLLNKIKNVATIFIILFFSSCTEKHSSFFDGLKNEFTDEFTIQRKIKLERLFIKYNYLLRSKQQYDFGDGTMINEEISIVHYVFNNKLNAEEKYLEIFDRYSFIILFDNNVYFLYGTTSNSELYRAYKKTLKILSNLYLEKMDSTTFSIKPASICY